MRVDVHWEVVTAALTRVVLQDIPKGNDRAASRMFWTWRASVEGARKLLCQHLLHAIANLHMRLQHEIASNDEVCSGSRATNDLVLSISRAFS